MEGRVMILLPTLNRVTKLTQFLKSAIDTGTTLPGLILVDKDDLEKNKSDYELIGETTMPMGWRYEVTEGVTMGDKVRNAWPIVKDCKWVMLTNDDHFCVTPGWDKLLISKLDGKNFVSAND